ncbi:hypothetical protein Pelo_19030 [Pelomyxa schiedti]|nr:hypothetical protein Pelo_19030 [Pelomyxa schiedti]
MYTLLWNFMRTGKLFVPLSVNADPVYNEAEYYQIQLPERPPPQPQRQQQPPAVIHDYFALRVMSTKPGVVEFVDNAVQPGGVYTGRIVNNKRDGRGKFTYMAAGKVQQTYDGGWSDGMRNGRGVLTWSDGVTHDGEWKNDAQDGWGVRHWPDGSWYEGLWRGGYWRRGTWHDPNGVDVKEGEWAWDASAQWHDMQGWGVRRKRLIKGDDGRYIEAKTTQPPRGGDTGRRHHRGDGDCV